VTIGHPISSIEGPATFSSREELPMISCPVGSRVAAGKLGEEAAYKEPNYSLAFTLWNPRQMGIRRRVAVLSAAHSTACGLARES